MKALLRALVGLTTVVLLAGALFTTWLLVRPLGWVYALAASGGLASLVLGAGLAARGSKFGGWLMED